MTRDTTPTSRRGYERPEQGDEWAAAWDALVEDLDTTSLYDEAGEISTTNLSDEAVTAAKLAAAAVGTGELSDEAVTAAKIAAAAVDSGAIKSDAVGVDELAAALGTDNDSPIQGKTHFEDTVHQSVDTEDLGITGAVSTSIRQSVFTVENSPNDVSSSSFVDVANVGGQFDTTQLGDNETPHGRFVVRMLSIPNGETYEARPVLQGASPTTSSINLNELSVSQTGDGEAATLDSGWVKITDTDVADNVLIGLRMEARVTDGTATHNRIQQTLLMERRFD